MYFSYKARALTLYFSAINVPEYFYNVTSNLHLSSDETVEATLYEINSGTLIARSTYTLPANSPIVIISHFVDYTIIFSSTSPFRISIDFLDYTFQAYNMSGFYAKITNIGPSPTRLYGLWLLSSTYARRINTSTWLEPGASQTFSVNLSVSSISEIRAVTTTGVNIFRISVKPPTLTVAPGPGGGGAYSKFVITSYNQTIAGPVSSKQLFVATVQNTGNASGTVRLEVWNDGNLVNSSQATIPAGGSATMSLYVTLPSSRGTYTWTAKAINTATGATDDSKSILVIAKDIYLQSRGAVSFSSFETLPSWTQYPNGSWSVSGGVLTGTDTTKPDDVGSIIYNASYATSGRLYLLVATQLSTNGKVHWGFILARDTSNWIFAGIYTDTKSYYLEIYQVRNRQIPRGAQNRSDGFTASAGWAILFAVYTPTSGGSNFTIELYTANRNFSYTASLGSSGLYPGLTVNNDDKKQMLSRLFDNFIASTSDPRIVTVTGLKQGWIVELYDEAGNLIARATADTSGKATLGVLASPITANGKIVINDASGNTIIQKTFTQIVGGDTYTYG